MYIHKSVLLNEAIEGLNIKPNGIYVDATTGGGGHSKEILKTITPLQFLLQLLILLLQMKYPLLLRN